MSLNKLKLTSNSESAYDYDDENQDLALLLSNQNVVKAADEPAITNNNDEELKLDLFINWEEVALVDIPRKIDELFVSYVDITQPYPVAIDLINKGEVHLKEKLTSALSVIDTNNPEHTEQLVIITHIIDRLKNSKYSFSKTFLDIESALNSKPNSDVQSKDNLISESITLEQSGPTELDLSEELDSQPFTNDNNNDNNEEDDLIAKFTEFSERISNMLSLGGTITFEDAKRTLDEYAKITNINQHLFSSNSELISKNLICKRNMSKIKEAGIVYQFNSAIDKVTSLSEAQRLQASFSDYFSKSNNSQSIADLSNRLNQKVESFIVSEEAKPQENKIDSQDHSPTVEPTISRETLNSIQDNIKNEIITMPTTSGISNSFDNIPLYSGKSSLITRSGASVDSALNKLISKSIGYTDFIKSKESTKYLRGTEVVQVTSSFKTLRGLTIHATENSFEFETMNHSRAAGTACRLATLKGWRHITAWGSEAFIEELTSKAKPLGIEVYPVDGTLLNKLHSEKSVSSPTKVVELKPTTSTLQVKPNTNSDKPVSQTVNQLKPEYKGFSHDSAKRLASNDDANVSPTHTLG
ncbi:hypothetical protein ACA544_01400 [Vibrio cholerae]|uniref:hypothetical protein n=1 Tax=Vibrio cholerae TaxID=666 RepID=UPI000E646F01|nr:hypothetical protein [Vibrio cholerae]MVC37438.1 hypothetical protein [Vibrio cholerae]TXY77982.1 hypothetical protein FXE80_01090 [Vibrio cholerae]GIB16737.1 hypothetical protein VCSRO90_2802 [Vibrio cholerae]